MVWLVSSIMNDRAANKQLSFDQLDSGVAPVADPASVPMPHYTVRVRPRARRLQLKVSPLGKVEVVAPHRVAAKDVRVFVERHGQWLPRTLARLSAARARFHAEEGGLRARIPCYVCAAATRPCACVRCAAGCSVTR